MTPPLTDRKDEELDRMLAELVGWTFHDVKELPHTGEAVYEKFWIRPGVKIEDLNADDICWREGRSVPRYTQSLDECARVEAGLRPCDLDAYVENVGEIVREYWLRQGKDVPGFSDQSVIFAHMTATARQRTIALISTLQAKP